MTGRVARCPAVVFDDLSTNSLGVVRGLGRRGVDVTLLSFRPRSLAQRSRHTARVVRVPSWIEEPEAFLEALRDWGGGARDRPVLVPTNDAVVELVARHRSELAELFRFNVAEELVVSTLVRKDLFYGEVKRLGLPMPSTLVSRSWADIDDFAERIGHRGIVKPVLSHQMQSLLGRKALPFASRCEYRRLRALLAAADDLKVVVQEFVPGASLYNLYAAISRSGEVLALVGYDKLRQFPLDAGSGSLCVSRRRVEAMAVGLELLRAVGHTGLAEVELKLDPRSGRYKLIEVNARTTTQSRLSQACGGRDVEWTYYLDCQDLALEPSQATRFEEGVTWISEMLDLKAFRALRRRGDLSTIAYLDSLRGPRVWAVLDPSDPRPTLATLVGIVAKGLSLPLRS